LQVATTVSPDKTLMETYHLRGSERRVESAQRSAVNNRR
jgi:hypothetical protein